ncbi:hypothetical protein [Nonomuraea sp. NPDC049400]|uniref:hypothetical protein n=1 Tax=Nonomuraea sp. NPDC049400 TaxID=3364352 RepID=UPI0037A60B91
MMALAAECDLLRSELDRSNARLRSVENALATAEADRDQQRTRYYKVNQRRQKLEMELKAARTRPSPDGLDEEVFCDPEDQFRHDVYLAWSRRIPKGEKTARPLVRYTIGPDFLASLETTDGVDPSKVVDVVVEILTGLRAPGRKLHRLRADTGGNSRPVARADGAVCWRVALQQDTPAARRLHFWRSAQAIELSRVVVHDDMPP